ncbi:GPR75 protein, partial [Xiphorhynchus elegans]|nr:GPR75 protein [Xiphorhynchus elegans]
CGDRGMDAPGGSPGAQLGANGSGPAELREGTHAATVATCTSLLALVFCLGSYGNLIVLLSFFDPALRKFRTDFDFMILSLSLCDLLVCGVAAPALAFLLCLGPAAQAVPAALCFAFRLCSWGSVLVSLQTVAAIALRRLRLVLGTRPALAASTPRALLQALALWAGGMALAALAMPPSHGSLPCLPLPGPAGGHHSLILCLYVADFLCCVAVVAACYVLIARALCHRARAHQGPAEGAAGTPRAHQPFTPCQGRGRGPDGLLPPSALSAAKDGRAVATCAAIVVSVLLCCLPLGLALLQGMLAGHPGFVLCQLELCGLTLAFLKSGLNPFMYARSSAGLRRRLLWGLRRATLLLLCCSCSTRTRLRAMGQGSLEANRNKSSHHDTNSAYVLSPKPRRKSLEQVGAASCSRDSVLSPGPAVGHQHCGQSSSTPMNAQVEPYYSVYNSSPSQGGSTPSSLQPGDPIFLFSKPSATHPVPITGWDGSTAPTRHIPVPSV